MMSRKADVVATKAEQTWALVKKLRSMRSEMRSEELRLDQLLHAMGNPSLEQVESAVEMKKDIRRGCTE